MSKAAWKRGLPPGKMYDGMVDDYEVYSSPGGERWHRKRTDDEAAQCRAERLTREATAPELVK